MSHSARKSPKPARLIIFETFEVSLKVLVIDLQLISSAVYIRWKSAIACINSRNYSRNNIKTVTLKSPRLFCTKSISECFCFCPNKVYHYFLNCIYFFMIYPVDFFRFQNQGNYSHIYFSKSHKLFFFFVGIPKIPMGTSTVDEYYSTMVKHSLIKSL